MAISIADFVEETNSATGTNNFVLTGATTNNRTFATALGGSSRPVLYVAQQGAQFEIGVGTFNGTTGITRTAGNVIRGSSGAGVLVNFSSAPTVRLSPTADMMLGGRHNNTATANPTASDDRTRGYSEGSIWFNVTTRRAFICIDDTASAARWIALGPNMRIPVIPGRKYHAQHTGKGSNIQLAANVALFNVIDLPPGTITSIEVDIATAGGAGTLINMSLVADDLQTRLWQGTAISASVTGIRQWTGLNMAWPGGPISGGVVSDGAPTVRGITTAIGQSVQLGELDWIGIQVVNGVSRNIGGTSFPNPIGTLSYTDTNSSVRPYILIGMS